MYFKNGRLLRKITFISNNHETQEDKYVDFKVEYKIKTECANLNSLTKMGSQTSAVIAIFDKHMKEF